ncbi:hypothetical protein PG984_005591 [Apiospora sp. TS-2023a]
MVGEGLKAKYDPENARCKPFGRDEFDQLLGEYRAVTDGPFCLFGPELMAAYPDAKVLLVERPLDSWYESFADTVCRMPFRRRFKDRLVNFVIPDLARQSRAHDAVFAAVVPHAAESPDNIRAQCRDVYRRHYREIRRAARPGQALEYALDDGWEPLCEFLGKPVPDVPFPHINDGAEFEEKLANYRWMFAMRAVEKLAVGAVGVCMALAALGYLAWGSRYSPSL